MGDADEGVDVGGDEVEKCVEGEDEIEMVGAGGARSAGGVAADAEGPKERLRRLRDPIDLERVLRVFVGESGSAAVSVATACAVGEEGEFDEPESHRASLLGCCC